MTQTFEQWAESDGLDMSVDWKGELTSPVTAGALRGWEAAQSAGQEAIYQARTSASERSDMSRLQFESIKLDKRIVYAAPVNGDEREKVARDAAVCGVGFLMVTPDGEKRLSPDEVYLRNAAPVNGGEREHLNVLLERCAERFAEYGMQDCVRSVRGMKIPNDGSPVEHAADAQTRGLGRRRCAADAQQVGADVMERRTGDEADALVFAIMEEVRKPITAANAYGLKAKANIRAILVDALNRAALTSPAKVGGDETLRSAVEAMVRMLEEGEWAEHVAITTGKGDQLALRMESAITDLINGGNDELVESDADGSHIARSASSSAGADLDQGRRLSAALSADGGEDKRDAERWRTAYRFVGAYLSGGWRQQFHFGTLPIPEGANLMKGSTAQHFTDAIDAAIAANQAKGDAS